MVLFLQTSLLHLVVVLVHFIWSSSVMIFCVFSAVSFADLFVPALAFYKSLPSGSAAWLCRCVWATNLFGASTVILTLHPFSLLLLEHSQYVLLLAIILFLIWSYPFLLNFLPLLVVSVNSISVLTTSG